MKKACAFAILLMLTIFVKAQDSTTTVNFHYSTFDFGSIHEENGPVSCKFKFTNTGKDTLLISSVRVSCGCTSTNWSEKGIAPGITSDIEIAYNPHNRPGKFEKDILFIANTKPNTIKLKISGNVIARPKTIREIYPYTIGNTWFSEVSKDIKIAYSGIPKEDTIFVYNNWDKQMKVLDIKAPESIKIRFPSNVLKSAMGTYFVVTYDAIKTSDWGAIEAKFSITTNDSITPVKEFGLSAIVVEDFSLLTSVQKANAPRLKSANDKLDFGVKTETEVVQFEIVIENKGKDDLYIRKLENEARFIEIQPYTKPIKSGEKIQIPIKINLKGRSGTIDRTINMITNDPENSFHEIHIVGLVE